MLANHTRITRFFTALLVAILAGLSGAGTFTAAAQDFATPEPDMERINIGALQCLDLDCMEFGDRIAGFEVSAVELESGDVLDTCVTGADTQMQTCVLEFPAGIPWEYAWDPAQTPDGYRPYRYSHLVVEGGPISPVTWIPFVPADVPGASHLVVQAALCTDRSCDEYSGYLDDFAIRAVDAGNGATISECVTDNAEQGLEHRCRLAMPAKGAIDFEWDASQVPDGYEWFGSLLHVDDGPDGSATTIPFMPIENPETGATVTPAPVTNLPVTGFGEESGTSQPRPMGLALGTALAILVLGCACYREVSHRDR
jgi:hypothetical protein